MNVCLRVILFAATISHVFGVPAMADVDATGRWLLRLDPGGVFDGPYAPEDWTQTGTTLTVDDGFSGTIDYAGTIDPSTGVFTMSRPAEGLDFPSPCPDDTRNGTVAADGRTLTGIENFHFIGSPTMCTVGIALPFTGSLCGDGFLDGDEECDDGSIDDGDGCSSSCQIEPCFGCSGLPSVCTPLTQGTPCGAAGGCVAAECDGSGSCASVLDVRTCRGAERSKLLIVDGDDDSDKLVWKWTRGTSTSQTEFADPLSTATYELCLFAGTAAVLAAAQVEPDAQSWSALDSKGYLYDDAGGSQDGIRKILLKGHDAGRAKIVLKGKGADLPDLHPPLTLPITVQLLNTDTDVCWSSTFNAADPNRPGKFKAKVP